MTRQASEILILDDRFEDLHVLPLEPHLKSRGVDMCAISNVRSTALYRGYQGLWEVFEGDLYLVGLMDGQMQPIDSSLIFDGQKLPILAEWFSGRLVVDRGERLTYEHMGWGGYSAEQLRLYVENGHIVAKRRFDQIKVLGRRYAKDFEKHEAFRKQLAANPDYALRPLGGFTEAGIKALGLTVFEGETFWPPDFTEDEYAEWVGEMARHCQRPDRPPTGPVSVAA